MKYSQLLCSGTINAANRECAGAPPFEKNHHISFAIPHLTSGLQFGTGLPQS